MPITLKPVTIYKADSLSGITPNDVVGLAMMEFCSNTEAVVTITEILQDWVFSWGKADKNYPSVEMYRQDNDSTFIEVWIGERKDVLNICIFNNANLVCKTSIPVEDLDFVEYDD
jgi:hypothetical protein